jgi:hypothetical protein
MVELQQNNYFSISKRLKLIGATLILLLSVLGFNVLLSLTSLDKLYVSSLVSQYRNIGKELQQTLEASSDVETLIQKPSEMSRMLEETKYRLVKEIAGADNVSVSFALPDGQIAYSTDKTLSGSVLPEKIRPVNEEGKIEKKSDYYIRHEDAYLITLPLRDETKKQTASLVIMFGEEQVTDIRDTVFKRNIGVIAIIMVSGAAFLSFFNLIILSKASAQDFPKRKISAALILIIVVSQIVFSGLNINAFKNHFAPIHKEKIE